MTTIQDSIIADKIRSNGFVVIPGVLSSSEILRLKESVEGFFTRKYKIEGLGKHQPNAVKNIPEINWIFNHPQILKYVRAAYNGKDFIFTDNCDAHMNMLSWWHKDTAEGAGGCLPSGYFERDTCKIYRVGLYLQDQPVGGLTVRSKSQNSASISHGQAETLQTKAGDIIIFDIRLTHAGQFPDPMEYLMLRVGRFLRQEKKAMELKWFYNQILKKPVKLSLFFTYGDNSSDTEAFIEFHKSQWP